MVIIPTNLIGFQIGVTVTLIDTPAPGTVPDRFDGLVPQNFWTGISFNSPETYEIDCAGRMMNEGDLDPDGELAQTMRETFDRVGLVVLRNTGLADAATMRQFANLVIAEEMDYEGGANPRDRIEGNVYEIGAPLVARLPYHHELAYLGKSTKTIGFVCIDALGGDAGADSRGATFVSDGVATTDAILRTDLGSKLQEHGVCYHRTLTDAAGAIPEGGFGIYNHWQKSFGTDDPAVAEAKANERGLIVEWGPERVMTTRYYNPAFEYCADLDRNLLYASLADHGLWFDTWPLISHLPFDQRPLHMTFGDDAEFTYDELEQFVKVYDDHGTKIDWNRGDVAVICNYRFAHGRPEIHLAPGEKRTLGVVLGEQFDRVGQLPGKW